MQSVPIPVPAESSSAQQWPGCPQRGRGDAHLSYLLRFSRSAVVVAVCTTWLLSIYLYSPPQHSRAQLHGLCRRRAVSAANSAELEPCSLSLLQGRGMAEVGQGHRTWWEKKGGTSKKQWFSAHLIFWAWCSLVLLGMWLHLSLLQSAQQQKIFVIKNGSEILSLVTSVEVFATYFPGAMISPNVSYRCIMGFPLILILMELSDQWGERALGPQRKIYGCYQPFPLGLSLLMFDQGS